MKWTFYDGDRITSVLDVDKIVIGQAFTLFIFLSIVAVVAYAIKRAWDS